MSGFKRAMLLWLIFKAAFIVAALIGLAVWWLSGCAPQPITITINGQQPVIASAQAVPAQGMAASNAAGNSAMAVVRPVVPAKAPETVPFFKDYRALVEYNSAACRSTGGRPHRDEIVPRVAQVVQTKLREQGAMDRNSGSPRDRRRFRLRRRHGRCRILPKHERIVFCNELVVRRIRRCRRKSDGRADRRFARKGGAMRAIFRALAIMVLAMAAGCATEAPPSVSPTTMLPKAVVAVIPMRGNGCMTDDHLIGPAL